MGTRAKIGEEIAALATEVRELAHRRGAGLPDLETLVEFIVAAFGYRARELAQAMDSRGLGTFTEAVSTLEIAPAAQELRACAAAAFEAADHNDLPAFRRTSQRLREALRALLEARAGKWRHLSAARDLYPPSWQSALDLVEHVRVKVPGLTRWQVLVWAGKALACATEDVWLWRLWQTGWREYQEDSLQRGRSGMSEEMWRQEVAQHTLPEEEARVVDSWPAPPDAEWPEGNTKALLPRLRKWQAKLGALEATETVAGNSTVLSGAAPGTE
jgi:hypothetical protein